MELFIHNIILWIESSKYILLFVGTLFEGPVVMIASGFLFKLGQFNFLPMYLALVIGDFVADIGWYCFGRYGTRNTILKYGYYLGLTRELLEKAERRFNKYHQKILIISKLTMGFGFAVIILIVAGIFKVPFKNYFVINLIGGFFWTAFLIAIGYFIGNIFVLIPESMKIIFILSIFILIILLGKSIKNYLKKKEV